MPSANSSRSSLDVVTMSECDEVVSATAWYILNEDVMLGFSGEMRHDAAESESDEE